MTQASNAEKFLPKLYVVGGSIGYADYLLRANKEAHFTLTRDPADADIAMFTGGEDVNPATYNQPRNPKTHFSNRDEYEIKAFNFFKENEIPMIGICRGHQFFAAMDGGRLIQHTTGHGGTMHNIVFDDYDKKFEITSAHHQMVDPTRLKKDWKVLGRSETLRSNTYEDGLGEQIKGIDTEIECIYYANINALGIQGHPEWMNETDPLVPFWRELIREYLL